MCTSPQSAAIPPTAKRDTKYTVSQFTTTLLASLLKLAFKIVLMGLVIATSTVTYALAAGTYQHSACPLFCLII